MSPTFTPLWSWLVHTAVGGSLLLGGVALTVAFFVRQPARRQRLAEFGAGAVLLLAVLNVVPGPRLGLPVLPPIFETMGRTETVTPPAAIEAAAEPVDVPFEIGGNAPEADGPTDPVVEETPVVSATVETASASSWGPVDWLLVIYLSISACMAIYWLLGCWALARMLRDARPAPRKLNALFRRLAGDMHSLPRLLVSHRAGVPFSCGVLRPAVVLPRSLVHGDPKMLRWVLAHELAHLARGDAGSRHLFGLVRVVYWFVPWLSWLEHQVRLGQEVIADAQALTPGEETSYAQFLLRLRMAPAAPVCATGVSGQTSDLYRRISMLLQPPFGLERSCPRRWSLAAAGGLLAVALLAAGLEVRVQAAVESPTSTEDGDATLLARGPDKGKEAKDKKRGRGPAHHGHHGWGAPGFWGRGGWAHHGWGHGGFARGHHGWGPPAMAHRGWGPPGRGHFGPPGHAARPGPDRREAHRPMPAKPGEKPRTRTGPEGRPGPGIRPTDTAVRASADGTLLGATIATLPPLLVDQLGLSAGKGLVAQTVPADSAAGKAGMKANDIVLEIDGKAMPGDPKDLPKFLADLKKNTELDAIVLRKGKKEFVHGLKFAAPKPDEKKPDERKPAPKKPTDKKTDDKKTEATSTEENVTATATDK